MLKLTHGSRNDERMNRRAPRTKTLAEASTGRASRTLGLTRGAFDYWQLRALEAKHGNGGALRSERFPRAGTLEADWNFCGADSMKGARAGFSGLPCRSNSV